MIALLRGRVAQKGMDHVVVDVHGVGYLASVPARLAADLRLDADCTLQVATLVREDAIALYGFATLEDRDAFNVLREVTGIGPKHALAILGHLSVDDLARAIAQDDIAGLARVPGIGRKIASRLCLELKGKLSASFAPQPQARPAAPQDPLPLALARLDYKKSEIDLALASPDVPGPGDAPLEARLRAAIGVLSRTR